jgi:signal transduction histidine kinase
MLITLKQFSPAAILTGTFLLFFGPFLIVELLPVQMESVINKSTYLFFHNSAEFFSMMVSFSLFGVGWYSYNQSRDHRALFLGVSFLAVGLVDFMHTMSNAAMPAFITPNSTNKSTQFWITARLLDSSALLFSAFVYPDTKSRWLSKTCLMTAAVAVSALTFIGVIFFPSYLPATAIQGIGLTPFKRYAEFLVIILLIAAGVSYWKRLVKTGDRRLLYYLTAIIICIFSEAVFASYKTGFDTYNVLGHIYKVIAFYLIYKGVFATAIEKPYVGLSKANDNLRVEIAERRHAEEEIRILNRELEQRVVERTDDLQKSKEELRLANDHLEQRVKERTMDLQNLMTQLEESRHELRSLASELVMAEERERKRIAGVLHDDVAQLLAATRMRLGLLQGIPSDPKNQQTMDEIKSLLSQSIQETRALMNDLGNPLLFDMGLKAACEALACRLMEKHTVRISCDIGDAYKHLNPDVKTILYQVFRELLHNVVKHSKAQNAHVMIVKEDGHLHLKVTDDGLGFDPQTLGAPSVEGGFGLYSIRERLLAIGGSLRIESALGTGTAVTAIMPAALD